MFRNTLSEGVGREAPQSTRGVERAAPQSNNALAEVLALRGSFSRSEMRWRRESANNIILFGVISALVRRKSPLEG